MRLTLKLALAILFAVGLVFALHSYLSIKRDTERQLQELNAEARQVGEALQAVMSRIWQLRGERAALGFIRQAAPMVQQHQVRWVWLDTDPEPGHEPTLSREHLQAARSGEVQSLIGRDAAGTKALFTYLPHRGREGRLGALEVSESLDKLQGVVQENLQRSVYLLIAIGGCSLLLILALGSIWVDKPLRRLTAEAERIGSGDLATSVDTDGSGEIASLAQALDQMRGRLASAREADQERLSGLERLRHTERLATLGRLSAGMAHELGTPLNVVSGRAKLIADGQLSADEMERSARIIGEQSERMATIMSQLLDFARRSQPQMQSVDLASISRTVIDMLQPSAAAQKTRLGLRIEEPLAQFLGDAGQMQQVLMNLLRNALQAQGSEGEVSLSLSMATEVEPPEDVVPRQSGPWLLVDVQDQGCGISAEHLPHLFDPFFTTKQVGEGTGLGLAIAHGIVSDHGGWFEVNSMPGSGSSFRLFLPAEKEEQA